MFYGETMPSSKVLGYANAFTPSVSKANATTSARARGFASRTSKVLCKNDLGRVQRFDRRLGSRQRYYAILGFLTVWRNGPVSAPINRPSNHEHHPDTLLQQLLELQYFLRALQISTIYMKVTYMLKKRRGFERKLKNFDDKLCKYIIDISIICVIAYFHNYFTKDIFFFWCKNLKFKSHALGFEIFYSFQYIKKKSQLLI